MKITATSFKRSPACTTTLSAPNPSAGHCQPMPLLETSVHSQASLGQSLVGSLLLSPGSWCTQGSVCALQESVPPVLSEFSGLYGGVNGDLLPKGLRHTQVCCPESFCPCSTADLYLHRRHSNTQRQVWLSLCGVSASWGLWPSLAGMGFDYKCDFAPHTILLGHLIALGCGVSFFGRIQHSLVYGCSATSCNFGVLTGEDEGISFYSAILITSGRNGVICGGYGVWL